MSQVATYRKHQVHGDSRIDLLLRLYRTAIRRIEEAQQQWEQSPHASQTTVACLKAANVVQGIESGLDLSQGEVPHNIARLCNFVNRQLLQPSAEGFASSIRVLKTLQSSFEAIREDALQVEKSHTSMQPVPDSMIDIRS